MLILAATTDSIQVVLTSAAPIQLPCYSTWRDITTTTYDPGRTLVNTNDLTAVNLIPNPAASTQRVIDFVNIFNPNTVNEEVVVQFNLNGTIFRLFQGVLQPQERLQYQEGLGWQVFTAAGAPKVTQQNGVNTIATGYQQVVLAADVINSNAVANTMQDITGLSFAVLTGVRYEFDFAIRYTTALASTGQRFSLNGPTFDEFVYDSTVASGTSSTNLQGYDLPAASSLNSTSAATTFGGAMAFIRGFIRPTADGTLIARFASEVASSAVTAKAGSRVNYKVL